MSGHRRDAGVTQGHCCRENLWPRKDGTYRNTPARCPTYNPSLGRQRQMDQSSVVLGCVMSLRPPELRETILKGTDKTKTRTKMYSEDGERFNVKSQLKCSKERRFQAHWVDSLGDPAHQPKPNNGYHLDSPTFLKTVVSSKYSQREPGTHGMGLCHDSQ